VTDRPYTVGLYMLRCLELGIQPSELCYLDEGAISDMLIERGNDQEKYHYVATQEDFDRF